MVDPVKITLYRWGGSWGPFKVNIPCGECTLTKDILQDTFNNELADVSVELEVKDWLSYWWEPLKFGAIRAPILVVEGKVVSQGEALNRGILVQAVIQEWTKRNKLRGNIVYGKSTCPYCVKAKKLLDELGVQYEYYDVVKDSSALYRMIPEVKAIIGQKTPVTVPQIWMDGNYVGGFDHLEKHIETHGVREIPSNVVMMESKNAC